MADIAYAVTIPVGIKYLMNELGMLRTAVRPPLSLALDSGSRAKLDAIIPLIRQMEAKEALLLA